MYIGGHRHIALFSFDNRCIPCGSVTTRSSWAGSAPESGGDKVNCPVDELRAEVDQVEEDAGAVSIADGVTTTILGADLEVPWAKDSRPVIATSLTIGWVTEHDQSDNLVLDAR